MNISSLFHHTIIFNVENLCQLYILHPFHSISMDVIDYKTFSPTQYFAIINQLLDIVSYIHQNNIIHGNIRISNIQLSDNSETVYLIDNFVSKECKRSNDISFDSPEVVKGYEISYKSDIWSIGCIIFYLFNGFLPFLNPQSILECSYIIPFNNTNNKIITMVCGGIFTIDIHKRISLTELITIVNSNYNHLDYNIKRNKKLIIDNNYYMSAFMNRIILPNFNVLDFVSSSIKIVIKIIEEYKDNANNKMPFSVLFDLLLNSDDEILLYNVRQVLPIRINDNTFDSLFILKSTIHNGLNFYHSIKNYQEIEYLERILSDKSVNISLDRIELIVLRDNYIGNYGAKILSKNLFYFPNLIDLKLENIGIDYHGLRYLCNSFSSISNLISLSLQSIFLFNIMFI